MKAIILAAGTGKRLGDINNDKPKCLLEFAGRSLLQRHLHNLNQHAISEIIIITGYQQQQILHELSATESSAAIRTIYNPDYQAGSIVSLFCAREFLQSGDDIVLMDADVLYDIRIIQTLINTDLNNCFLLDRDFEAGDEPVKLCVRDGLLIDFRKQIDKDLQFDFQGESVGFFRFSASTANKLAELAQHYIDNNRTDEPYEEVIRDLLLAEPDTFDFEDISGLSWIEIDFPEDIEHATQILEHIE